MSVESSSCRETNRAMLEFGAAILVAAKKNKFLGEDPNQQGTERQEAVPTKDIR
jgi:hypothetical protein